MPVKALGCGFEEPCRLKDGEEVEGEGEGERLGDFGGAAWRVLNAREVFAIAGYG